MIKGLVALMNHSDQRVVLRICKGVLHIFDVLFEEKKVSEDLINVVGPMMNTIKTIFSLSKVKGNDKMFLEEQIVPDLLKIINDYYIHENGEKKMISITSKKIVNEGKTVEVHNQEALASFFLFTTGTIKNISEDKKVVNSLYENNALYIFVDLCRVILDRKDQKAAQLLVQVTGVLRNLVNDTQNIFDFIEYGSLELLDRILIFINHKELMLNLTRILSKVSNNKDALVIMSGFGENFIYQLAQVLIKYRDNLTILVRAAYVLGNLTTDFQES